MYFDNQAVFVATDVEDDTAILQNACGGVLRFDLRRICPIRGLGFVKPGIESRNK
jgi:hypothetical protein